MIIIFESICKLLKASHIYDLSQQIFMYLLIQTYIFKMMQNAIILLQVGKLNNVSRVMPFRLQLRTLVFLYSQYYQIQVSF